MPPHILLTIDVEDWFQVENLRPCCPVSSWSTFELRVERNTHKLLDLFNEVSCQRSAVSEQHPGSSIQYPASSSPRTSVLSPQSSDFPTSGFYPQAQRSSSEVYPPSAAPEATRALLQPPISGPVASALNNKSSESCLPAVCLAGKSCLTSSSPLITNNGQLITDNGQQRTVNGEQIKDNGRLTTDHGQHEKVRGTFFVLGWIAKRLPSSGARNSRTRP